MGCQAARRGLAGNRAIKGGVAKIRWSVPAIKDMEAIRRYAAGRDEQHLYLRLVEIATRKAEMLSHNPGVGSPLTRRMRKARLSPTPYVLLYRLGQDEIILSRVIHGSRDWMRFVR